MNQQELKLYTTFEFRMSHFLHKFIKKVVDTINIRVNSKLLAPFSSVVVASQEDYDLRESNE